jgi:teichoic acid transport system permease protein
MTTTVQAVTPPEEIPALVEQYGLQRAGARQPFGEYLRQLWGRRRFILRYSTAANASGYSRSFLGQAWQLITPLLNVGVYFLIFGLLLKSNRGVHNFIAYLAVGVFVFSFCTQAIQQGSKSITGNTGLTRALQFPRAVLPVATTLMAFLQMLYSMVVLIPLVLITGEPPSWTWFELIPAFALQAMFALGLALIFARIGARIPDTSQTLPFVLRVWFYLSGIMFSVDHFAAGHAHWVKTVLTLNPGHIYLTLARHALLSGNPIETRDVWLAVVWAVVPLIVGFVWFWRGEEEYGNV